MSTPAPDQPARYWPAYLPAAAQPGSYWLTAKGAAALAAPDPQPGKRGRTIMKLRTVTCNDPSPGPGRGSPFGIHSGHLHRDADGTGQVTVNVRNLDQEQRPPGRRLIWGSVTLLAALAGIAFAVSFRAQFGFVWAIKQQNVAANLEAVIPDAGMLISAMLALGIAVQGRARTGPVLFAARSCVIGFAALSAVMNFMAAGSAAPHPVTVYVMPPVAFAVCTDLAISVVRRFYYGLEESASPWRALGRAIAATAGLAGLVLLYSLRLALAWSETWTGLRQMVLNAAPLPKPPAELTPPPDPAPGICEVCGQPTTSALGVCGRTPACNAERVRRQRAGATS